jgi:hypothetical protein
MGSRIIIANINALALSFVSALHLESGWSLYLAHSRLANFENMMSPHVQLLQASTKRYQDYLV